MKKVLGELKFAATTPQPVLLLGETGTGKGVFALALHQLCRANKTFIRAQPSYGNFDLVQSELFGHEKGAFTGATSERKGVLEEADGGSIFLDEIDNLPAETQVMLLHSLQEGAFRRVGSLKERNSKFRLIAATNKNLSGFKSSIRPDLFHRLSHHIITIPPLRERLEDIAQLSETFLQELCSREKISLSAISLSALAKLKKYNWPGNIRELRAVVEQAIYRAKFSGRLTVEPEDIIIGSEESASGNFRLKVDEFEQTLLIKALKEAKGNVSEAARILEVDRTQLKRMLKRFSL